MDNINPDKVLALYKSRPGGVTKIRLIELEDGYAIVGNMSSNPYSYTEEYFKTYKEAVDRWNELLSQAEIPF